MATVLLVYGTRPVEVSTFIISIRKSLKLILGLTTNPLLVALDRFGDEAVLEETRYIEPGNKEEGISVKTLNEGVTVSVITQSTTNAICISPDGRTALHYGLAAAVAIGVAECLEAEVQDPALVYTRVFSQSAEEFAGTVKVDRLFDNISEAAQAFSHALRYRQNKESPRTD